MHCGCGLREYEQMRRLDLFTFAEDRRLGRHEQQLFEKMRGATVLVAAGKHRNVPTDRQQMLGRRGGQERRQDRLGAVERTALGPYKSAGQRLGQERQALVHPVINTAMLSGNSS